jgi:UDP-GlcNAc:undecaprenyl-phosphate GlcNAc-1-phosphate transferase
VFFPDTANTPSVPQALREIWGPYAVVFIGALLITLLMTPVFRLIAIRWGIYDMPDTRLKPHSRPIPYLGGLAIFLGVAAPLVFEALSGMQGHGKALWGVLGGLVIIVGVGLVDDLVSLPPWQKIIAQVVAALLLVDGGVIFRGIPGGIGGVQWLAHDSPVLLRANVAFQVLLVVAACNATNLLDGLDGLCSGVTTIIAVGFLGVATSIAGWYRWGDAPYYTFDELIIVTSLALCGATLGFLPYNFNPASIFMGDAGSMLLGFMCATQMIMFAERQGMLKWFIAALLIFGLPIFDTALAFSRRWRNGKPIFQGDRSHFYDQLVDRGLSVKQTVLVCYGLALFFALLGLVSIFLRTRYALLLYLLVVTALTVIVTRAGMLRVDDKSKATAKSPDRVERTGGE